MNIRGYIGAVLFVVVLLLMSVSVWGDQASFTPLEGPVIHGVKPRPDFLTGFICAGYSGVSGHGRAKALPSTPVEGKRNALVIFAKFLDEAPGDTLAPDYAEKIFDPDLEGSLTHFFLTMSNGAFAITGSTLKRRYTSRHRASYYAIPDPQTRLGKFGELALEILESVDRDPSVDFGDYDNDGPDGIPNSGDDDGYVDFVFINLRSAPENLFIGPATGIVMLGFGPDYITDDPAYGSGFIRIRGDSNPKGSGGAIQQALSFSYAVGSMAHEYGHVLGLPDLNDMSFLENPDQSPVEDSAGIGAWGLMGHGALGWYGDDGPAPFCAYSLEQLGWVGTDNDRLVEVRGDLTDVVIEPVGVGGRVYKIPLGSLEYFLVVNRQRWGSYYDRNIPKGGLLIWHVDRLGNNADERRKLVDLECADGLYWDAGYPLGLEPDRDFGGDNLDFWAHDEGYTESHGGNRGDATDVFDGVRFKSFSPVTNPSSGSNRGSPVRVAVDDIRSGGGRMVADLTSRANVWSGLVSDVTWSGEVNVIGDILVDIGSTLTVEPGTVVRFATSDDRRGGDDPLRCELIVLGTLRVRGDREGVLFTSAAERPRAGDWYGIRLADRGLLKMTGCVVEYSRYGLRGWGMVLDQYISGLMVRDVLDDGISLALWMGRVEISDSFIESAGRRGIYAVGGQSGIVIRGCTVRESSESGIYLGDSVVRVWGNVLSGNGGEEDGGIYVTRGVVGSIEENRITGAVGIRCVDSSPSIRDNLFEGNRTAILTYSSTSAILENDFRGNDYVLQVAGNFIPSLVGMNSMTDNAWLIRNLTKAEISAENNWWGTVDPDQIAAKMEGPVAWRPFLRIDPNTEIVFALEQNFPNPFNQVTTIRYQIPITREIIEKDERVSLILYNPLGQRVKTLVDEKASPGFYAVTWDGRDEGGRRMASGVYFYRMVVGEFAKTRKLLLME